MILKMFSWQHVVLDIIIEEYVMFYCGALTMTNNYVAVGGVQSSVHKLRGGKDEPNVQIRK